MLCKKAFIDTFDNLPFKMYSAEKPDFIAKGFYPIHSNLL